MRSGLFGIALSGLTLAAHSQALAASHISPAWAVKSASEVNGRVRIVLRSGRVFTLLRRAFDCSYNSFKIAPDGFTVGWVVGGSSEMADEKPCMPDAQYVEGGPVVWRAGRIVRDFGEFGGEINWSFYGSGDQIAYHAGPAHFDVNQGCELHDILSGRLLKTWSKAGKTPRPDWTAGIVDEY